MKSYHAITWSISILALSAGCASAPGPSHNTDNKTVTADEIAQHAHEPVELMLQRKFPGIQVLKNEDGDVILTIRGMSTTSGAPKTPLYVVNDMEMDPGGGGILSIVDPYDIETIRVLKGPDAAIYGLRGADGVIVIRTKGSTRKN